MSEQNEIKLHALDYWQVIRNRYGVILLAFFLVFMTAVVIAYLRPSEYLGKTQIQVKREASEMKLVPGVWQCRWYRGGWASLHDVYVDSV